MKKPRMILFDYGQTIIAQDGFNGLKGTEEVLKYAVGNKYGLTAEQVQAQADSINRELGRADPSSRHLTEVEVPNYMFTAYLYDSLGIKIGLRPDEIDRVFWDAASPGRPTEGIVSFLDHLFAGGIRTGVVSNISFAGNVVAERINRLLPGNHFEFIIASSEYLFRKPNARIFSLALEFAGLEPSDAWYVGDDYDCDVVGARNAGILPVWYKGCIDRPQRDRDDVMKIYSWNELEAVIDGCL